MNKNFIAALCAILFSAGVFGQGLTLYNMDYVPQSMKTNPALIQKSKVHFSIAPIFNNFNLSLVNNGFVISDLVKVQNGSTVITDASTDATLSKLQDNNYISTRLDIDFLTLGFKVKDKHYFNLNVTERVNFAFDYSKDFLTMMLKGPGAVELRGTTLNLTGTGIRFNHFREYGLGYSYVWNDNLTVGGKLKLLQGMAHFNNEATEIQLTTNNDENFGINATSTISMQVAGLGFVTDSGSTFSTDYLTNFENIGLAVDLGGSYKINDKISASLSVTDLGYIRWKTDARRYYNNKVEFDFEGIDLQRYLDEGDAYVTELTDSLKDIYGLQKASEEFSTTLIAHLHAGGEYKFNKSLTGGALLHGEIFKGKIYPSFTAMGKANVGNWLQAVVSYSILNRSYSNIGLGAALNLGPLQIYSSTDNILGAIQADYAKNINVRFGMNIIMGYKPKMTKEQKKAARLKRKLSKKDTDGDGVNDYEDKCPKVAGFVKGCPDKDNDGVADNEDLCPDSLGLPELFGCPDRDGDNVADKDDKCPDQYGALFGCPDTDQDSIADKDDPCPKVAGTGGQGCPDTDGDGVKDSDDKCPEVAGDPNHAGCPDTDQDGIYDNDDRCPDVKGDLKHLGCSDKDTDKDGTPDVFDDCPFRSGDKANKGCPGESSSEPNTKN